MIDLTPNFNLHVSSLGNKIGSIFGNAPGSKGGIFPYSSFPNGPLLGGSAPAPHAGNSAGSFYGIAGAKLPSAGAATTQTLGATTDPYAAYGGQAAYNSQVNLYDQAINNTQSAVDRLPGQLQAGNSTIDNSYQNAFNQLLGAKNQGESAYNTNKTQTAQDWRTAKNTIGQNAGSSLQGLLRLLGSRGAGGSAAYQFGAPGAVIQGANQQRSGVGQTYGRNQQSLDTNWNNYLTDYGNSVSDIGSQRDTQRHSLQDSVNSSQATLLQTLAQLSAQKAGYAGGDASAASQSYLDQANSLLDKTGIYSPEAINYKTQAYAAPSLDSYTVNPNAAPQYNSQTGDNFISPYLASLLGKDKNKLAYGA